MSHQKFNSLFELYEHLREIGPEQEKEYPFSVFDGQADDPMSDAIGWYLNHIPIPFPRDMLDIVGENIELFKWTYDLEFWEGMTGRFVDWDKESGDNSA